MMILVKRRKMRIMTYVKNEWAANESFMFDVSVAGVHGFM